MPPKVLVIDDNVMFLDITKAYFQYKGFEVAAYLQPTCPMLEKEAESCFLGEPIYDLILTDNDMPNMQGIDFLEHIHERGCKIPSSKKAILGGDISIEDRVRAERLGVRIFHKPCSFDVLDEWVKAVI